MISPSAERWLNLVDTMFPPTEAAEECDAEAASCFCALDAGHDGPHECISCNGAWTGDFDGDDFEIVRFP